MKKLMAIFMVAGMCILTACAASSSEKSSQSGEKTCEYLPQSRVQAGKGLERVFSRGSGRMD